MDPIIQIKSTTVVLPYDDIDTDQIIPARYINTNTKEGLGEHLFTDWRHDKNGEERLDFPLNDPKSKKATILVAGHNFGCGSSREHAPWALLDFGIRCIIGQSFADIFYNNCFKNGMLPITLNENQIQELTEYSKRKENIEINLSEEEIIFGNKRIKFDIDPFKKKCLLNGLDDIALSLEKSDKISSYEDKIKKNKPWLN